MPARVLHLIWALDLGGAERQVVEIVRGLDRARFEPTVGCLVRKGRWGDLLEREGIPVVEFAKQPRFDPGLIVRLRRFLRAQRFDIVHTHAFTAATWGRLAAALAGTPVVIAHEHSAFSLESRTRRLVDRLLTPLTHRWIVVSESLARDLANAEKLPTSRLSIVRNGIRFTEAPRSAPDAAARTALAGWPASALIGTVGRFERRKGLDVLVDAFALLARARPGVGLALVGEGPLQGELERQVRTLGLSGRARLCGRRDDVAEVLSALDVFVLPSHAEGLSIALLEAGAAGRPVVATSVGGNGEVVRDGHTGLLVPPGDAAALADAVGRLLDDGAAARRMGQRVAAEVRDRFAAGEMVRAIEGVYEDALAARASSPRARFKKAASSLRLRPLVRRAVARATGRLSPPRCGLRILTYHRVNADHPGDRLTVHPLEFERQMAALAPRPVLPLPRAVRALQRGEPLPEGAVAITFDDGFHDNLACAAPILQRYGLPATFFVATAYTGTDGTLDRYHACCDRDRCLSWDDVRALLAAGHTIGGHGRTHRELGRLGDGDARDEIAGCRADIEEATGLAPSLFCYPRGSETSAVRRLVAECGYDGACSVYPGANAAGTDVMALRRTEIAGEDGPAEFHLKLEGAFDGWHHVVQRVRGLAASPAAAGLRLRAGSAAAQKGEAG
jgi:glycosyltransferase involved in cell wall biosynthesis/peptidoglycan/xylan/chitin deacetylase (PgdA/CDA1 family)